MLESLYEDALCYELEKAGFVYVRQQVQPVHYKDTILATPLRTDLIIENSIIIECKSTINYNPVFESQLLTYLRLTKLKLGYVINFGEPILKNGIHRVVN